MPTLCRLMSYYIFAMLEFWWLQETTLALTMPSFRFLRQIYRRQPRAIPGRWDASRLFKCHDAIFNAMWKMHCFRESSCPRKSAVAQLISFARWFSMAFRGCQYRFHWPGAADIYFLYLYAFFNDAQNFIGLSRSYWLTCGEPGEFT